MPEPEIAGLPADPKFLRAVRALGVDAVTAEVLAAFAKAGIPSILLKGPSIARWLYPTGGRSYGDTDLLVREADFAAAGAVLRRLGFVPLMDRWAGAEHPPDEVGRAFVRTGGGKGAVDLHRSLPHVPVAPEEVWDAFSAHTATLVVAGVEATVLDATALALHVALHALQHGHAGHTEEDLRRAVAALPVERWAEVAGLAVALGVEAELALGLRLDPAGAAVAGAVGLPQAPVEASAAWPVFAPRGAGSLDMLATAPTLGGKLSRARWTVFPTPAKVRYVAGTAGKGPRALLAAYCSWWAGLARSAVPALRYAAERRRRLRRGG